MFEIRWVTLSEMVRNQSKSLMYATMSACSCAVTTQSPSATMLSGAISLEHLPNGKLVLLYCIHYFFYSFSFKLKIS
jgi:hypothetical protein